MANMWQMISRETNGVLNDAFIMKFDRYLDWSLLSENYNFSLNMLRIYQHRVSWGSVLMRTQFPESFLREMAPNFDDCWFAVSKYQKLSQSFIRDYAEQLDWFYIPKYQVVPTRFLAEHARYIERDGDGSR